jgi:hypothetical protein
MDIQKIASTGTAVAVLGTGTIVGGNHVIDQQTGGPEKRAKAEETTLRQIVREEIKEALIQAWPTQTSGITGLELPNDYRNQVPQK